MGQPKWRLPVPGAADPADTFLRRLVSTLLHGGLTHVSVITGAAPVGPGAAWPGADPRVRFVHNERWQDGQLQSLRCGLAATDSLDLEAVMVALVDVPLVRAATVATLIKVWRSTRAPIVRPSRSGAHGHPVIFDRTLFRELLDGDVTQGAKPIVRAHQDEIVDVDVDDPGAFTDFDTPEDLKRLRGDRPGARLSDTPH